MKAYSKLLFIFLCIFSLTLSVSAESCSNATKKDLAGKATYIKASYEIIDESETKELEIEGNKTTYKVPNYYFKITIYNVKEGLKVDVSNTGNDHKFTVTSRDTEAGNYTFEDYDFGNIYNYEFVVKSDNSECSNITLKTVRFTKPRYNAYSEFAYCQNSSNFYCQKFVGTETNIKSTDEFLKKIKANRKDDVATDTNEDDIKSELKNNWIAYLIAFILVTVFVGGGIIAFVLIKKKKESVL